MKYQKRFMMIPALFCLALLGLAGAAAAAEPNMADYHSIPIFTEKASVKPNILIMMDNSGSMNNFAYKDHDYACSPLEKYITDRQDDAEENLTSGEVHYEGSASDGDGYDLDAGERIVGLRFQNIRVPKGVTITNAYIRFTSSRARTGTTISVKGHAADDAPTFSNADDDISSRATTSASVSWSTGACAVDSVHDVTVTNIVSELTSRSGWWYGNAMVFIFTPPGTAEADFYSRNESSSKQPMLHIEWTGDCAPYYGYFSPDHMYSYSGGLFTIDDTSGQWSGNFLNFLTMRRIDIVRKVMTGGKASSTQGIGAKQLVAESGTGYSYTHVVRYNGSDVSPYNGDYYYGVSDNGRVYVDTDNYPFNSGTYFTIKVQKDETKEPEDFHNGAIAGVMQKVGDKALWGNLWFNSGQTTASNRKYNGGSISNPIGQAPFASLISDIANTSCDTWTPLGESFYVAMQHFKAEAIDSTLRYPNGAEDSNHDPYDASEICAKNFVLLLTDGASTMDAWIPSSLLDYADDNGNDTFLSEQDGSSYHNPNDESSTTGRFGSAGTDFLKDVALYARTNDLRTDVAGFQNILLYNVYAAFGEGDENAKDLLKEAARNGGFQDRDGDLVPDGLVTDPASARTEWDENGDNIPDTYYEADDGYKLQQEILKAITDILKRASSGTAASVLATNEEGEGNMTQAYFKPTVTSGSREVTWTGYMQSLWIDPCGNLREDSNQNNRLDLDTAPRDKIIEYYFDSASSETKVKRYTSHPRYTDPNACDVEGLPAEYTYEVIELDELLPIFEAGKNLAYKTAASRKIFTFIDKNNDGAVLADADHFDSSGEVVKFDSSTAASPSATLTTADVAYYIKPFLGVKDGTAYSYLGSAQDERVINLINYIRGTDIDGCRNRTMTVDAADKVWKLGDVVHSTPVTVAKPPDNFHVIYSDESYQDFYDAAKSRETMIYVGANDGMLHAFTSWKYDPSTGTYTKPTGAPAGEVIGEELWAYIPQTLLPHLKWLANPSYSHVYYVDLKPKVFDAKILADDTHYTDADSNKNWGTFMLLGLRMGGQHIWAENEDFDYDGTAAETRNFYPTYSLIDITEPRAPKLIWERTYDNIASSFSMPAVVKVNDKWFAVFGSGPTEFSGWSTQNAHLFVVDLETGQPWNSSGAVTTAAANDWLYQSTETEAFFSQAASLDKELNFNVDSIYIPMTYDANANNTTDNNGRASWKSKMLRMRVACSPCFWESSSPTYAATPNTWTTDTLFSADRPITGAPSLSIDQNDAIWVYFGTGRFIGHHGDPDWQNLSASYPDTSDSIPDFDDRKNSEQQYIFGVKDPFFNPAHDTDDDGSVDAGEPYHNMAMSNPGLTVSDLFDSTDVQIGVSALGNNIVLDASQATPTLYGNGTGGQWDAFVDYVDANYEGWYIPLALASSSGGPSERMTSKPAVVGGIVMANSYTPIDDPCQFGGTSAFFAVFYTTGTAYKEHILRDQNDGLVTYDSVQYELVSPKDTSAMVGAPPPSIGVHVGQQEGARAFVQQSTGEIISIDFDPALNVRSGVTSWRIE